MTKKIISTISLSATFLFASAQKVFADWAAGMNAAGSYGLPEARLSTIIANILDWLLTIVGVVGVIGFVIAGIMYLTANGDEKKVGEAKKAMMASIYGVLVAICGMVVLWAATNILSGTPLF
jgi:cytochrome bd-type quinol oxidase subunit 2